MTTKVIIIDSFIGQNAYSKQFIRNELAGQSKNPVTVKISSLGGAVDDALNIYDQFVEHGNVTAELSAFVASSATIISLGAKTVRMNENSFYLIHKAMNWVDAWGSMNEDEIDELISQLEATKRDVVKVTLQLAKMYSKKSGKPIDQIIDLMKQQTWLTAEEAKAWGFVDEVFAPDQMVNYLDNLQMVAMITSNDFPAPPRKKENQSSNQKPIPETVNEDNLFEKLWNRLVNKGLSVTTKNNVEMKKTFLNINNVLNIDGLESTNEGVFLNEEQLQLIEDRINDNQQLVNERDTAVTERDSAISERDTATNERDTAITNRDSAISEKDIAVTSLSNALNLFDSIDQTIKDATTPEAKATAIRNLLAKVPSTPPVGIQRSSESTNVEADWETIDNLEHNKDFDANR